MRDADDPKAARYVLCWCGHFAMLHSDGVGACLCGRPEGQPPCACKAFVATRPLGTAKPRLSLLPWGAFSEVAEVMESGVPKHGAHGWREPDGKHTGEEYLDKALRHLAAHLRGQVRDSESRKRHVAHAVADLLIALELEPQ